MSTRDPAATADPFASGDLERQLLESARSGIAVFDTAGRVRRWNHRLAELTGLSAQETLERDGRAIFRALGHPERSTMLDDALGGVASEAVDLPLVAGTGAGRTSAEWVRVEATPLRDAGGAIVGAMATVRDATEQKRGERALAASEARYRSLFDHMLHAFAYVRMIYEGDRAVDFEYLAVNPAFDALTGLANAAGKRVSQLLPGLRRSNPELFEAYGRVARSGVPERLELYVPDLDNWYAVSVFCPERDHCVALFDLVTERKRSERVLREREEHLRLAQEAAHAGSWEWDLTTGEHVWSDELWKLYRLETRCCAPSHECWLTTVHPDDRERAARALQDAASSGGELDAEWRVVDPSGGEHWLMSRGRPVRDADGRVVRYLGIVIDISERKRAEAKLREYQSNLQRLAFEATVAEERERRRIAADLHDRIAQALAVARGKLVAARELSEGPARAAIDLAAGLVTRTIEDTRTLMFDISPPILYDLGLSAALSWLADEVEKHHGLRVELTGELPHPLLDDVTAAILVRAARELVMNVIHHAGTAEARVAVRRDGDVVEVAVEDDGAGFDVGTAAVPTRAAHGFGLFAVREQMARLGGSVELRASPGRGTRAVLRVPIATLDARTGRTRRPPD
ncbi:MAG: PAS domain S-box protein [Polyangiaceae bacterium]|nr:PAS domain S-box protein [Polyangiaceae bacterium]